MGLLQNRFLRRFSVFGRLSDMALIAGLAFRFAQRQGWIGGGSNFDASAMADLDVDGANALGAAELVMAAAAVVRLIRRKR